jgi:electron transport complex protein RnfG
VVAGVADAADPDPAVYAGYGAGGALVGYAIPAAGAGYQDTIRLIYGFDPAARRVVGMQILESRETPGLGDRIFKDLGFVAQFRDLAVEPPVELVKDGATAPHEVDAITGATISSAAVVGIIRGANEQWLGRLPGPGEAPPLAGAPPPAETVPGPAEERGGPVPGGRLGEDPR